MKLLSFISSALISLLLFFACENSLSIPEKPQEGTEIITSAAGANIRSFCEDGNGYIWMTVTQNGLLRFDGKTLVHYTSNRNNPSSLSANMVNDMTTDSDGNIWVATQKGVDRYCSEINGFSHYAIDDYNAYVIRIIKDNRGNIFAMTRRALLKFNPQNEVFERVLIFPLLTMSEPLPLFDSSGELWIRLDNTIVHLDSNYQQKYSVTIRGVRPRMFFDGKNSLLVTEQGRLLAIDTGCGSFSTLPPEIRSMEAKVVNSMHEINGKILLFYTNDGTFCFDKQSRMLYSVSDKSSPFHSLSDLNSWHNCMFDKAGNLWYAKDNGGYDIIKARRTLASESSVLPDYLIEHPLRATASNGRYIWMILENGSFLTYDIGLDQVAGIVNLKELLGDASTIRHILCSRDGRLLLNGSERHGHSVYTLIVGEDGTPSLECKYTAETGILASFDNNGNLWGAGVGTRFYFAPRPEKGQKEMRFERVEDIPALNDLSYASRIISLKDGRILVGYTDTNPLILDPATHEIKTLKIKEGRLQIYYSSMLEDCVGDLWMGTTDNGLFRWIKSEDRTVLMNEFESNGFGDLQEDGDGHVYVISGDKQLYQWSRITGKTSLLWNDISSFPSQKKLLMLSDKIIAVYTHGEFVYYQDYGSKVVSDIDCPINITLSSDDKELASFSTALADKDHNLYLKMKSVPDNFDMHLSVMDENFDRVYKYIFEIKHFDSSPRELVNMSTIALYGLSSGRNHITFRVIQTDNLAESPLYNIIFKIRHPWYEWATLFAGIIIATLLLFLYINTRKRKNEAEKERKDRIIQEEVNMRNIDFFANISHEFRAPLTLINGAVSSLYEDDESSENREHMLGIVSRNVNRMLKLISQMLDFNKLDHDMLKLQISLANVSSVIRRSWEIFEIGAMQKNIDFNLIGCEEDRLGFVDSDKLEKIIYNLLSNALKFTPLGGRIDVNCIFDDEGKLQVTVSDTGIGLQEDKIDKIFERFTQVESVRKSGGTGIGLYYTKSLVELHHGQIRASNRQAGDEQENTVIGAQFCFTIPLNEDAYSSHEHECVQDLNVSADPLLSHNEFVVEYEEKKKKEKPTLLIIDDDYELVYYMKSLLSPMYNVYFRFDAMSGYNQIKKIEPDAIICDIMMIDVDGLQFCRMVKENIEMCHIPVIMLTARSSVDDQINSLNVGAEAYIIKPFNHGYLTALIRSIIDNRQKIRHILTNSISLAQEEEAKKMSVKDREFMDKVYENLESSFAEGEMDIDYFSNRVGVSRSKFFYKIKALTGQTPNEFFTTYKLNRAAKLIIKDKYKLATIAEMVGFSSPSHFSVVFKKQFGVLPSQYIDYEASLETQN